LIQRTCDADGDDLDKAGNDVWNWFPIGGTANLQNMRTMKCINVAGASMSNGAHLIQWNCGPETNNGWHPAKV
jgi:hypothetical protein